MANMRMETKNTSGTNKKPRVYFTCHPKDFDRYFSRICDDIFKTHDCNIYYTEDMTEPLAVEDQETDLGSNNLFVVPVTRLLLTTPNRAMDEDIPYAFQKHIPVLPIMMENGIDRLYAQPDKFGDLQYLKCHHVDATEISYEEKLKKYLDSVLISEELMERVRGVFAAYIFLSYRKKDRRYANELMRLIHDIPQWRDIAIWFDEFLTPGEDFRNSIDRALDVSKLFALLVTPSLLEKTDGKLNFIMKVEYPAAQEKGIRILPAEMEFTDWKALCRFYKNLPTCIKPTDDEFYGTLLEIAGQLDVARDDTPERDYLLGLAYLDGIDVEVNRNRAVQLILKAAERSFPEAMHKMICLYTDGVGVSRDGEKAVQWSRKLAHYFFDRIFTKSGTVKSKKKLSELFTHIHDPYWSETIRHFLDISDQRLPPETVEKMYGIILAPGVQEYTLLFEACEAMTHHKEATQVLLCGDILVKSAEGQYSPYGPLFWYIPEYGLYECLLLALATKTGHPAFSKMLALSRDVCWIFGQYNRASDLTDRVDGGKLLSHARLTGIRKGLCQLFFAGHTDQADGCDLYPRCFNIGEAKMRLHCGCGVLGRMSTAFEDELGMYSHEMYSELCGEYIGIVAGPYQVADMENTLTSKSCAKLRGLFLSPTRNRQLEHMAINDRHIRIMYVPENIEATEPAGFRETQLEKLDQSIVLGAKGLLYYKDTITLPKDLNEIPAKMFMYCRATAISIPDSVVSIGEQAFWGCRNLAALLLPESIVEIGSMAFYGCGALKSANIPGGVRKMGSEIFGFCQKLSKISISNGATRIERGAFSQCESLLTIAFPDTVTAIGSGAFFRCASLETIRLPEGITEIEPETFSECYSLKQISLPKTVTEIGPSAFQGCTSLEEVYLPDSLKEISNSAFKDCAQLKRIYNFPDMDVLYIHVAFGLPMDCVVQVRQERRKKLLEVVIDQEPVDLLTRQYFLQEGTFFDVGSAKIKSGVKRIGAGAFCGCTNLSSVSIPDSVVEIGEKAFEICFGLASIDLPDTIRKIGAGAFTGCIQLRHINIPEGVTEIGDWTFAGCASLTGVHIPESVTRIGKSAFEGCTSLTTIRIPDGVTEIGKNAFMDCSALETIDNCPWKYCADDLGYMENCTINYREEEFEEFVFESGVEKIPAHRFSGAKKLRKVFIPDTVKKIAYSAFMNCTSLETVIMSKNITEISEAAFLNCHALTSIELPAGLTQIEKHILAGCASLSSVVIPDGVTAIGDTAFFKCSALRSVILPESVSKIGQRAFSGCSCLCSITIPDHVEEIGEGAFSNCSALMSVTLPKDLKRIGRNVFENCTRLKRIDHCLFGYDAEFLGLPADCEINSRTKEPVEIIIEEGVSVIGYKQYAGLRDIGSVQIPNSVIQIGYGAFEGCASLTALTIPASVREIQSRAFGGCVNLKEVKLSRRFEEALSDIFSNVDLSGVRIKWLA